MDSKNNVLPQREQCNRSTLVTLPQMDYDDAIANTSTSSDQTVNPEDMKIRDEDSLKSTPYVESPRRPQLKKRISKRVSEFAEGHRQQTQAFMVSENKRLFYLRNLFI